MIQEQDNQTYDEWFCAKVKEALDDERPRVSHDEAMKRIKENLIDRQKKTTKNLLKAK